MNILVTGSGGFIGSNLCDSLGEKHKLRRIYSSSKSTSDEDSFSVDLTDGKTVKQLIKLLSKQKIDVIIHLASKMASPDKTDDLEILRDNISITEHVVSLAKKIQPKIFINFSSMAIYPNVSGLFSEDSLPVPQKNADCIYGLSKYCSEVIIDFSLRNEEIRIIHLRLAQVHGNGMREDRIIPVMRNELEESNAITVYGNGERESNFIEINKLTKCVENFLHKEISGIYNIGDQNLSYYELAKIMVEQYGNERSTIVKQPNGNKEKFNLDTSKYQELINT